MKNRCILIIMLFVISIFCGCGGGSSGGSSDSTSDASSVKNTSECIGASAIEDLSNDPAEDLTCESGISLSPADWEDGDLAEFSEGQKLWRRDEPLPAFQSQNAMITGTTSVLAIRSGFEALKKGGTAADAVIATALAQIALVAGSYDSYAGIFFLTYYDAEEDKVYYLDAGWNTPLEENDALSIPTYYPSGRTALVPGFFAGVAAAHDQFGNLPFCALFEPAIYFAEEGFEITTILSNWIASRQNVLSRVCETREIFTDDSGRFYQAGDWLTQPALSRTLKRVSAYGKDYIYNGPWTDKFVAAVQRDGGKITREDMEAYDVIWSDPVSTTFRDYEIYSAGLPALGGVNTIEALNVLEAAGFPERGAYTEDPESLFWFMQINRLIILSQLRESALDSVAPDLDLSLESRATKETAAALWEKMTKGELQYINAPREQMPTHSDGVVAMDEYGNIAALLHSSNTIVWGETGIFVDGISISDIGKYSQQRINDTGPGKRLPAGVNPTIVFENGSPVLATSCINSGLQQRTLAVLYNRVAYDMDIETASMEPYPLYPVLDTLSAYGYAIERVIRGAFDDSLIRGVLALGQNVSIIPEEDVDGHMDGNLVGIEIDPSDNLLTGITTEDFNGDILGY